MSSTKTCLVTVPIPEVRENNCFVLGEWCKLFKDRESWEKYHIPCMNITGKTQIKLKKIINF